MSKDAECFVSKAFEEQQSLFTSTEQSDEEEIPSWSADSDQILCQLILGRQTNFILQQSYWELSPDYWEYSQSS